MKVTYDIEQIKKNYQPALNGLLDQIFPSKKIDNRIIKEEVFIKALSSFKRDYKINRILD